MQEHMAQKASLRRPHLVAEPAGLPGFAVHSYEHGGRHRSLGRWTTIGGCLAVQLLVVVAMYKAHAHFMGPRLQQRSAVGPAHSRANLVEQAAGGIGDGSLRTGEAITTQASWQPRAAALAGELVAGGRRAAAAALPKHCKSCRSCGVRLADADLGLLRGEIDHIAKALAEERAWPGDAVDASMAEELGSKLSKGDVYKPAGLPRAVVDEKFGPITSANVPGVEDIHAELDKYNRDMVAVMTLDAAAAAARQQRTRAADLGLQAVDNMAELGTLRRRVDFLNGLLEEVNAREKLKVCIAATTSVDIWGVRRELLPWLQYHTELGVTRFYLLYDGMDAEAVKLLSSIQHVRLTHLRPPFASDLELAKFEFYTKQAKQWSGQPGNYELMVKQGYGEQEALHLAEADGMDWLLHIDPDELFHPGGPVASITAVLARQPPHVPSVRFMNFEGQPEAGDLTNRFEQVTLFRVHKHFITPEAHYYRQKYKLGDSTVFLTLYANGKSAVRVGIGARQLGPHFFSGDPSPKWQTQGNPRGEWRDAVSDDSIVLHYAYSYMSDVESKANRSCPASYLEAARAGDRSKIKACFVIDFDQDAYIAAASGRAAVEDFFYSRMVLSEGSRVRCRDPEAGNAEGWCTLSNIDRFKYLMEKIGLMKRVYTAQIILRQHERAIKAGLPRVWGGSTW